ncbi:ATP-binding protein [Streptomyces sp. NBC_00057]|uniref:ATP-binding protein n=1 Tax=Streptomyces sp. NBC_00057 TaxID=2975634 RepID=UPI003245F9E9
MRRGVRRRSPGLLGLAIVHALVTAHGGRMELRSEPGKGCRFRVLSPLLRIET